MNTFSTQDIFIASLLAYLYGTDSLICIEDAEFSGGSRRGSTTYTLAVPQDEAAVIVKQYETDSEELNIMPRAYVGCYNSVVARQKQMRQKGHFFWNSPAWQRGEIG